MTKKKTELKRKYDIFRHHAWAGTVLLSVLLALRIFLEISDITFIPDSIILSIGIIIVLYTLISLFLTYKYRSGISTDKNVEIKPLDIKHSEKIEKQKYKIEKKKIKNKVKLIKKKEKE